MSSNKCIGCDTPIPFGSASCPMCGAKVKITVTVAAPQPMVQQPPIIQTVTEVHHHHHANPVQLTQPVLVEATGKKWKKMYLWAWLFFFLGMTSCMTGVTSKPVDGSTMQMAGVFWLIGFGTYIRARFGAWWHHG